jgi:hypothetical protein
VADLHDMHDLLEWATDAIEPRGGAAEALRTARRRRARRRGTVAVLASAAAVVAVVVGVRVATGGTGESAPPPAASPTGAPTQPPSTAPVVAPARIEPVWDPRGAEGLPVTALGVPRVMPTAPAGSIDRPPVALLDDGSQVLAVAADGDAVVVALPEGIGRDRMVSLSADGTRVAVAGADGAFWRHVNSPTWRPGTGGVDEAPDAGSVVAEHVGASYGLLAGDRAFLPLRGDPDRLDLTPLSWVDDDTVAFRVTPPGSPKEYLVTWNVETGALSRISCWYTSFEASFATDLLG